jgi:hypothetical protein
MPTRSRTPKRRLLSDAFGPDLERRARAWLAANPQPATEFDRRGNEITLDEVERIAI